MSIPRTPRCNAYLLHSTMFLPVLLLTSHRLHVKISIPDISSVLTQIFFLACYLYSPRFLRARYFNLCAHKRFYSSAFWKGCPSS
ncbi:hypothetical protein GDO86_004178 [Hymenochirus boettgeri]|uniref:Uncharacterized protein n=1 Tax=Hymenochirus boettgeri TaxID=247094 RepID=A0A8T2K7U6_9PIPI|nr:hypothetical protein GDO86_004178 [Hymenochirus boettgeri]